MKRVMENQLIRLQLSVNSLLFLFFILITFPKYSFSQTIDPPIITCASTDESTGDVTINWSAPTFDNCGPFTAYVIFGATNPNGPYVFRDTITDSLQVSIVHRNANATVLDWYYYMVTIQDCPGATFIPSDTVEEELLLIPDLNYVTVTPGGVRVTWYPSTSPQTAGYIIYYRTANGFAIPIDTIYGRLTNSYVDASANPDAGPIAYTIAAIDGCNTPTVDNDTAHYTIHLTISVEPCLKQAILNWTKYRHWAAILSYQIEMSIDNAPFTAVQPPFPDGSYGYNYSLAGISGDTVCFRIRANRQGDTVSSASNVVCFAYNQTLSTAFNYIRNVSVNTGGGVDLQWYIDSAAAITAYSVIRSSDGNTFSPVATIPVTSPVLLNSYTDATAPTSSVSFYYKVNSFDACDSLPSTIGRTILLTGSNIGNVNRLTWNAFGLDNATVLSYTIYRLENGSLVPDTTVAASVLNYQDVLSADISGDGTFCYVVEANFNLNLPFVNDNLTSTSNQLCLYQTPVIYVPNAFVPGGKNNIFKPTLVSPNVSEYEFAIFDRWGKKLFETHLVNEGWDGTNNGELLPLGGYAYYVKVVSKGGVSQEKKGMVVLVR